jgi:hypothetical protein
MKKSAAISRSPEIDPDFDDEERPKAGPYKKDSILHLTPRPLGSLNPDQMGILFISWYKSIQQ